LQGEGYVYLAELCFLQGASPAAKPAYIEQALKVRPHDGKVLFAAGNEAALAGDLRKAIGYWKQSFQSGPDEQAQLIDLFAGNHVPVAFLLQSFEPDLKALRLLEARYSQLQAPGELRQVLGCYARAVEKALPAAGEDESADLYLELHRIYRGLNEPAKTLECLRRAATIRPNDYDVRYALGECLSEQRQFDEAEKQLDWCAQRRPDDPQLKAVMATAVKGRIDLQSRPAGRILR
jgi:tetratricopeptide (TPR) repeat protein